MSHAFIVKVDSAAFKTEIEKAMVIFKQKSIILIFKLFFKNSFLNKKLLFVGNMCINFKISMLGAYNSLIKVTTRAILKIQQISLISCRRTNNARFDKYLSLAKTRRIQTK